MKAIIYEGYGPADILRCEEIDKPRPLDDEVLVKVCAASINPLDWKVMQGGPLLVRMILGVGKPKIRRPGVDMAGQVEAVGRNVTALRPGDDVFGTCKGAFAEYATSASVTGMKSALTIKPKNVTYEQAASAPVAALTALQGLRDKGRIKPGHEVLINGAAGGVGTFAVQISKQFGACVTGVCSTRNVDMVRSIGADRVVDYTQDDFTQGERRYDLVLDCVGNRSLGACRRILKSKGILVLVGAPNDGSMIGLAARLIGALVGSWFVSHKMIFFIARSNQRDLTTIGEFLASGKLKPVIDRSYRLNDTPEAFRYVQEGHARGKVLIVLDCAN